MYELEEEWKLGIWVNQYNIIHLANRNYTHAQTQTQKWFPFVESFPKIMSEEHEDNRAMRIIRKAVIRKISQ